MAEARRGAIAAAKLVSQCPGRARRGAGAGQMPQLKPGVSDLLSSDVVIPFFAGIGTEIEIIATKEIGLELVPVPGS